MASNRNVFIAAAGTAGVRITLGSTTYTGSFSCTSYPVFSGSTTDGTAFYAVNSPLKQPLVGGSLVASNSPTVAYDQASGTALITFAYGSSFSSSSAEYESAASPRRYQYILHASGHTPATAYSAAVVASTAVVLYGSVDVRVVSTASVSFVSVSESRVEGSATGGF